MNSFDKHIREKMNQLEVKPSAKVGEALKSQYPKPGFVHFLRRFYPAVISAVVLTCLSVVLYQTSLEKEAVYNPFAYEISSYDFNEILVSNESTQTITSEQDEESYKLSNELIMENGNCRSVYSYYLSYSELLEKGFYLSDCSDGINASIQDEKVTFKALKPGDYLAILSDGNYFDTICIRFLKSPEIFEERTVQVCGLQYSGELLITDGEWINNSNLKVQKKQSEFFVSALSYGEYQVIRRAANEYGFYTDTIDIVFVPKVSLNIEILSDAKCFGDEIEIQVRGNKAKETKVWLNHGDLKSLGNAKYCIVPDYANESSLKCYFRYHDASCEIFDSIQLFLPQKPSYELTTISASCVQTGRVMIESENTGFDLVLPDLENLSVDNLPAGTYKLVVVDENGCEFEHTVEIENKGSITAEFDILLSLDGMSVQTIDMSRGIDEYDGNLTYEWYLNGKLVSDLREPELNLNEITNTIRLRLNYGESCYDDFVMNDIRPDHELIRCANFFTPNGDGENDVFQVILDPRLVKFNVKVMNRAGNLIYEWNEPENAWDGTIKGGQYAAESVYFYVVQAFDSLGKPVEKKGTIQLIRD